MARNNSNPSNPLPILRELALAYPEVEEGIACEGTSLECRTVKVQNKAFVFLGQSDLRLKLSASLSEAAKLATKDPGRYNAGKNGWIKVTFGPGEPPSLGLLERWLDESYRLFAPDQPAASKTQSDRLSRAPRTLKAKARSSKTKRRA